MAAESLKEVAARVEAAIVAGVNEPGCMARVQLGDLARLLETLKRYGGRRDWRPTNATIEQLPGPVRRYIRWLESELERR